MNKRKLLIVTGNMGKFPEIVDVLKGLPLEFVNLTDLGYPPDYEIDESAMTFEGNAIIKVMTAGKHSGLLALADDSGLEVDALGGRPGIFSARYAPGTDADRRLKLLGELKDIPNDRLGAQFRCVVAIYDPDSEKVKTCEGIYRGRIVREERGTNGFGYDPIFYNDDLGKTNAEMSLEEKNSVSHRGMAVRKAMEILSKEFLGKNNQ
jgi:XTP/dITP diphosphohydrolase